jgi:hypothetical protein
MVGFFPMQARWASSLCNWQRATWRSLEHGGLLPYASTVGFFPVQLAARTLEISRAWWAFSLCSTVGFFPVHQAASSENPESAASVTG